jgi:hypothetical protein
MTETLLQLHIEELRVLARTNEAVRDPHLSVFVMPSSMKKLRSGKVRIGVLQSALCVHGLVG